MAGKARELSVLFADVSGSTRLYEKLGDTEAFYAVERCIKRMQRAVETFHGREVKSAGDEVMAVFDSAEEALQAAGEMQQRVADLPPVSGVKLEIRVGFHHGRVVEEKGEPVGPTVDTAVRLTGLAKPGQVLTSGETVARLPELLQVATHDLDQMSAKGQVAGTHVFEVLWHEIAELPMRASLIRAAGSMPTASRQVSRLCIRYAGNVIVADDKQSARLSLGRDGTCDLVIRDRRASRHHGQIERRGDRFVLTDMSTNGTYVTFKGEPEIFLRHKDIVLRGSGRIAFAASADSADADVAEFEHLP